MHTILVFKMTRPSLVTLILALVSAGSCGPAARPHPRPSPRPERPGLQLGQPVPETVRATRLFTVKPSDDALAQMCASAATGVPLVYACGDCRREAQAAARKRIAAFQRWLGALGPRARVRKPAEVIRLHARQGQVLGLTLSRDAFARLLAAPPGEVAAAFVAMVRGGIGPYLIETRSPLEEAARAEHVILRVGSRGGKKEAEVEIDAGQIRTLAEVQAELKRLASVHGTKLPAPVREDLAAIAAFGLAATLTLDKERTRAAQAAAVEQARATRLSFEPGQEVVKRGEVFTLVHRQILHEMESTRCVPCPGGLARCAPGPLRRIRAGAFTSSAIRANRDFHIPADPGLLNVLKKQVADGVPRVFTLDGSIGRSREEKLGQIFGRAAVAKQDRWTALRDDLERTLGARVIRQLLKSFDNVPLQQVRAATLELYARAQAEPIMATAPPPATEACTLRRPESGSAGAGGRGRAGRRGNEETSSSCAIVPLVRLRLQLPALASGLSDQSSGLPGPAQQAVVALVQELLVANTTPDPDETERRRKQAVEGVKSSDRFYRVNDVVVAAKSRLTQADIYLLTQMYSVRCYSR